LADKFALAFWNKTGTLVPAAPDSLAYALNLFGAEKIREQNGHAGLRPDHPAVLFG
jgi:hypothetical protein